MPDYQLIPTLLNYPTLTARMQRGQLPSGIEKAMQKQRKGYQRYSIFLSWTGGQLNLKVTYHALGKRTL